MTEAKKPYEPKLLSKQQRELLWLRYQGSDDVLGMLIGHIDAVESENKKLRTALEPFANAGLTMRGRFLVEINPSDVIELSFAEGDSYITNIYADDLQKAQSVWESTRIR